MSKIALISTRRGFFRLVTTTLVTSVAGLNAGCDFFEKEQLSIEQRLIRFLNYHEDAQEIGKSFKSQNKLIKSHSLDQLTQAMLQQLDLNEIDVQSLSEKALNKVLSQKVREDFVTENTVIIGTWMFSNTEAMLCAIAHSYRQQNDKTTSES